MTFSSSKYNLLNFAVSRHFKIKSRVTSSVIVIKLQILIGSIFTDIFLLFLVCINILSVLPPFNSFSEYKIAPEIIMYVFKVISFALAQFSIFLQLSILRILSFISTD